MEFQLELFTIIILCTPFGPCPFPCLHIIFILFLCLFSSFSWRHCGLRTQISRCLKRWASRLVAVPKRSLPAKMTQALLLIGWSPISHQRKPIRRLLLVARVAPKRARPPRAVTLPPKPMCGAWYVHSRAPVSYAWLFGGRGKDLGMCPVSHDVRTALLLFFLQMMTSDGRYIYFVAPSMGDDSTIVSKLDPLKDFTVVSAVSLQKCKGQEYLKLLKAKVRLGFQDQ